MSPSEIVLGKTKEEKLFSIIILSVLLLITMFVVVLLVLRQFDKLEVINESFYYYLLILSFLGVLFLRIKKLSVFFLGLLFLEFTFGMYPYLIYVLGLTSSLNSYVPKYNLDSQRFVAHPTLVGIPKENFTSDNFSHSNTSIRNNRIKFNEEKPHIAIFGGSTTYDIGVKDFQTWVSVLNDKYPEYSISNNGVPGYSTAEHVIQTAFYSDRAGSMPKCSIYYIGWNDIRTFGSSDIDSGYANYHLISQGSNLNVRYLPQKPSPILNFLIISFVVKDMNIKKFPDAVIGKNIFSEDKLFDVVIRNLDTIIAINRSRGIQSVFIGQILNKAKLKGKNVGIWTPYTLNKDVWPLQNRFNNIVKNHVINRGEWYYSPDISLFDDSDFLDTGHFSSKGSSKFANLIAEQKLTGCI